MHALLPAYFSIKISVPHLTNVILFSMGILFINAIFFRVFCFFKLKSLQ